MIRALFPIILILVAVSATADAGNLASQAAEKPSARPAIRHIDLLTVPQPDVASVDKTVQEQIHAAQNALNAVLAKPDASNVEKAKTFGSLGQIYQAYSFDDAALACYENAARLEPQSFRWNYYSGYLHQASGNTDSAVHDYQRALTIKRDDRSTMLRLGNLELTANQLELAKSWFSKAADQQSPSAAALLGLGKVALIERQYPAARKYFSEALAREPQASSIHYQLAMAYRGLGEVERMQEQLKLRGNVEPTIQDPLLDEIALLKLGKVGLLERGSTAIRENRFADAVACYRELVSLDPSDAIAYKYLGVALAKSGNREEALQQYNHALQLNPNNPTVHYNLGILLFESGKEEAAISHFREAVRLDPGSVAAHFQLANLLMRRGKDDAGREYQTVVSLDPQNAFARLMQAMAAVHSGNYAQARSLLEDAAAAFPKDADIGNALARVLAAAPDPAVRDESRGLTIIEGLVQNQQGDSFEEGITLAMALAATGRFKQAVTYQEAIIQQLEQSGRSDLARPLHQILDSYQHEKPWRQPWQKDDPVFTPVPGTLELSTEQGPMTARP
jgi:tetratricopeptide (TPR) repeat protein